MSWRDSYTPQYTDSLYDTIAAEIRTITPKDRRQRWTWNLVTLYVNKGDESEQIILNRFGMESLVYPLRLPVLSTGQIVDRKNQTVNELHRQAKRALAHSNRMLDAISREVNDNSRTCLLLPAKNYGKDFASILRCVRCAAAQRSGIPDFKD